MRDMTTAEFAKANLAALEEPIAVRRYTKTLGTYYPAGYEPPAMIDLGPEASPDKVEALRLQLDAPGPTATKQLEALIAEVAHLKRELAKRPAVAVMTNPRPVDAVSHTTDPFAGLAKQDRDFFERKLGKRGKK